MSVYTEKLDALCGLAEKMPGTAGARTIRKVAADLEGDGPIGDLLHSVDSDVFAQVIELLIEFRKTGCKEAFNSIHASARERLGINFTIGVVK